MNFVIESVFVGLYSFTIFWFIHKYILDRNLLFFIVGFLKHILGWFLGIHTYYIKHGDACKKYVSGPNTVRTFSNKYIPKELQIWVESIGEGILFVLFGILFTKIWKTNKYFVFFMIGFSLHILFEFFGFHDMFCIEQTSIMN